MDPTARPAHQGDTTSDKNVGAELQARRVACGISVEAFCSVLSISPDLLAGWESGAIRVPALNLFEVSHLLSVDMIHFFAGLKDVDGEIVSASPPPEPRS